jgi:hypothetical protein
VVLWLVAHGSIGPRQEPNLEDRLRSPVAF